ncbi:MAG: hypothetical protein M3O61_17800 [Gemmatimonadota bacterium]|nr:hypothetical protein [Gemmatimonadota bacterium]
MTRKEGKGYLRGDLFGEPGAYPAHPLELVGAAERTEGIAVGDDARRERGANATERLDFVSGREIEVDDRGDDRLIWSGSSGIDCRR